MAGRILRIAIINATLLTVLLGIIEVTGHLCPSLFPTVSASRTFVQSIEGLSPKVTLRKWQGGARSDRFVDFKNRSKDSIRIACLGASTTNQASQNFEATTCGLIEHRLQEKFPGNDIRTAIFAEPGRFAMDGVFWAEDNASKIKPDIVVTLFGFNDVTIEGNVFPHSGSIEDFEKFLKHKRKSTSFDYPNEWVGYNYDRLENCFICQRLSFFYHAFLTLKSDVVNGIPLDFGSMAIGKLRKMRTGYPYIAHPERDHDSSAVFRYSMERLLKILSENSIRVIVLGQPVLWSGNDPDINEETFWVPFSTKDGSIRTSSAFAKREMDRFNEIQKNTADQFFYPYISLDEKLPKTREYYFDDCHYTDKGSMLIADIIYPAVENEVAALLMKK